MRKSGRFRFGEKPINEFPALYHAHHARHPEDIPFWTGMAQKQAGRVLELGCGTGRVLIPLAQVCPSVFGLDNDADMLAFLRRSLPSTLRSRVNIWLADLAAFHLETRFSLIVLPCNTYSTLPKEKRQKMLVLVHHHLEAGGVFAVSMPNPEYLLRLPATAESELEEIFPHPSDGEPVQVSSSWKRTGRTFSINWNYDHLLPDGRVARTPAQVRHLLESPQNYLKELADAGFEKPLLLGDFDGSPYDADSTHLILIATRRS
jgi:SAM-dependent methyltransferase